MKLLYVHVSANDLFKRKISDFLRSRVYEISNYLNILQLNDIYRQKLIDTS